MPLPQLASDSPLFIVSNARSGARDASEIHDALARVLQAAGRPYELFSVAEPRQLGSVARLAAERATREQGAVVVAGGDGTINCVAHAVLPTGRPLGILPKGTFNYSSRAHGVPLDPLSAARALVTPRLVPVQVGVVNQRIFLVNASLGLYPRLQEDREWYKRRYGRKRWVAAWAALSTLLNEHPELTLEVEHDGEREVLRASTLFVGNNPLQLEQVGLPEAEALRRRKLAAVIGDPVGRLERLRVALLAARGKLARAEHVRNFAFERMTVRPLGAAGRRPLKVAVDGEICRMRAPLVWSVAPEPLVLMTPADA
jgi:diacylglycerol kinase family enzyme